MNHTPRTSIYPIAEQFLGRWSPRAFTGETITEATLLSFIEAARWAPSAYNAQPWHFLYSLREGVHWQRYLDVLIEFNRSWAQNASALLLLISKTHSVQAGKEEEQLNTSHVFDTGTAWGFFALQAHLTGWHAHAMTGFDKKLARRIFNIPADYELQAIIAVGKWGNIEQLPEVLQARETPSSRRDTATFFTEGVFS